MLHNALRIFAPAKLNLFLHVTGKRDDGYHLLQSLMVFADVGDALEISDHDGLSIDVEGPFSAPLGNPRDNLVYKAATLLAEEYKVPSRAKIVLTKNLPVASGIGGGSSDAAAALKGLAQLWNLPDEATRLQQLAQKIGADVSACLYQKSVWAEGVGDKLTPVTGLPPLPFVLANPLVPTPTAAVFKKFRGPFSPPLPFSGEQKSARAWISALGARRNNLTDAAISVTPEIRPVLDALGQTPDCLLHRLSGSGATCFGIYSDAEAARTAACALKSRHPSWWVTEANMLT